MERLLAPHQSVHEIEVAGRVYPRDPDGTFHLPNDAAKVVRKWSQGDMTRAGIPSTGTSVTYECPACGFQGFLSDSCGRCGPTEMARVERVNGPTDAPRYAGVL